MRGIHSCRGCSTGAAVNFINMFMLLQSKTLCVNQLPFHQQHYAQTLPLHSTRSNTQLLRCMLYNRPGQRPARGPHMARQVP